MCKKLGFKFSMSSTETDKPKNKIKFRKRSFTFITCHLVNKFNSVSRSKIFKLTYKKSYRFD